MNVISCQLVIDGAVLDTVAQTFHVEGKEVHLTAFEYLVLKHLMEFRGRLVPGSEIEAVLYSGRRAASNVLHVTISRLRHKLVKADVSWLIDTVRSRGFRIDAPAAGGAA